MKAVVLAGGRGTRLQPLTTTFPKPLMPVGEMPILELLLRQLKAHGVDHVTLLTGHLAYLIESYFGDGSGIGIGVSYIREQEPLGTAGPLQALRGQMADDFLVMNGDLLTDVDYTALMDQHRRSQALITISTYRRDERIELGVLTYGSDGAITGYDEKPVLHLDISMGLYVLSPRALDHIPDGYYDMPFLIRDVLAAGERVVGRAHDGAWLDIGRLDDYAEANELFARDPEAFLPRLP